MFTLALLTAPGQPRSLEPGPVPYWPAFTLESLQASQFEAGGVVYRTSLVHIDNNRSKQRVASQETWAVSVLFRTSPFASIHAPFQTATRRYTRRLQAARRIATWRKRQSRRKALLLALTTAVVARSVPRQLLWTHERVILCSQQGSHARVRVRGRDGSPRPRLT